MGREHNYSILISSKLATDKALIDQVLQISISLMFTRPSVLVDLLCKEFEVACALS